MSDIFHKSVYACRSSGYKYRTLSTNTGEKKRHCKDETNLDRKFSVLKREITSRIEKELNATQAARDAIKSKFEKVQSKIDSMLELQNTMTDLRSDLCSIEQNLGKLVSRVYVIESAVSSVTTLRSPNESRYRPPIYEDSDVTQI